MIMYTCCLTGQTLAPKERDRVLTRLNRELLRLIQRGVTDFLCGAGDGFDMLAGAEVLRLRETHPQIRLILVLPCEEYRSEREQDTLRRLMDEADETVYTARQYYFGCLQRRSRYLVSHSGYCLCYCASSQGETGYILNYARNAGLKIRNLAYDFDLD